MNYEEFKDRVQSELKDYLGSDFANTQVVIKETLKVNKAVDQVSLLGIPGHENASPSVSVSALYESYEKTGDFEGEMEKLSDLMKDAIKTMDKSPIHNGLNFEGVDKNVFFTLVNAEQNRELLETVPHREFEDLAIIYRWNVGGSNDGLFTNIITNQFAEQLGKTEPELYELAKENTKELFPSTIRNMNEVVCEMMFGTDELPPEMEEEFRGMMAETPDDKAMYVISNSANIFGAASMLYEENLYDLSQKLDSNLYILPSSVHEVIAISDKFGDADDLAQMVYEINMDQVNLDERLSNQVYHYDKDARTLRLATDTVNKSLSDNLSEQSPIYEAGKAR